MSDTDDTKQCRICLDGEDPELGRLIRPCLCKGSVSYVHVKCLQRWRNTSASRSAFYACPQCGYHYHFARTRIVGIATNPVVVAALSTLVFTTIVLLSSFITTWFMGDQDDEYLYWTSFFYPVDVFRTLVRTTINFFDGGMLENSIPGLRSGPRRPRGPRSPPGFFMRLVQRFLLGLPIVGAGSIAHMLLAFPTRFYWLRPRARRVGRQSQDMVALLFVAVVIAGALRALYQVYLFTERIIKRLLLRAEDAILEVS